MVLLGQHGDAPSCGEPLQGSADLTPRAGEVVVAAAGIDGFYGSPLDAVLCRRRRTHLVLAGRGFETTVHSTLRRANDRGYECLTVTDACGSLDPRLRRASISTIEMSGGIFGAVAATEAVLAAIADPAPVPTPTPTPTPTSEETP